MVLFKQETFNETDYIMGHADVHLFDVRAG